MFTPIWLTAVACYASGSLKVRLSFRSQNVPLHLLNPSTTTDIRRHLVTVQFSQLTNMVLTLLALIIALSGVHCWLKYQHWPVKQKLFHDQKGFQWRTVPYNSDKSNAQKLEISKIIDVYSYRRAHRPTSCSAGEICRGCEVVKGTHCRQCTKNALGTLE